MFWRYVNGRRKRNSVPKKLELDGQMTTSDEGKAYLFSKFFSSDCVNHEIDTFLDEFIDNRNDRGYFSIII